MKHINQLLQSIACLWLAAGFASPAFGGVLINSYRLTSGGGGGGSDPYYANVSFLLHGNGSNGATSSVDQKGHADTAQGSAQLSTARVKFGTASMRFPSAGSAFTYAAASDIDLGAGDFTVELFVNFNTAPTTAVTLISNYPAWSFQWRNDTGAGLYLYYSNSQVAQSGSWTPSTNVWYYVVVKRTGTAISFWIDGTQSGSNTTNASNFGGASPMAVGSLPYAAGTYIQTVDAWIDEVRVTKGVSRDVSSVPTNQFPDS